MKLILKRVAAIAGFVGTVWGLSTICRHLDIKRGRLLERDAFYDEAPQESFGITKPWEDHMKEAC